MKTTKNRVAATIITFFLIGASTAYSSGTPALDYYIAGSISVASSNIIIVTKYDSSYTYAEAEAFSQIVTKLLGLVSSLAGSQGISTAGFYHYTPSQVATWGFTDADVLKTYVKSRYKSLGFSLYAFVDIKRVTSTAPEMGHSMRIDLWLADLASVLGMTGDYLYVASFEIPETYLTLLGSAY